MTNLSYRVHLIEHAEKGLRRLAVADQMRVGRAIKALGQDPRPRGRLKLTDEDGWRIRVGNHRVIYLIDDDARTVLVLAISKREDAYRF